MHPSDRGVVSPALTVAVMTILAILCCAADAATCTSPNVTSASGSLSASEINLILLHHNAIRLKAQPTPATMPLLKWSPQLAQYAQNYISQCKGMQHSATQERLNKAGWAYIGENLAGGQVYNGGKGWGLAIDMWGEEGRFFTHVATCDTTRVCGTCTPQPPYTDCGHYTQVVWANTTFVGCGYADCPSQPYRWYYNCWYAAGGNIRGRPPYVASNAPDVCPLSSLYAAPVAPPTPPPQAPPNESPAAPSGSSNTAAIAGGAAGGVLFLIIVIAGVVVIQRRRKPKVFLNNSVPEASNGRSRAFTHENSQHCLRELEEQLNPLEKVNQKS